jgi:hypothetical protein
LSGTKPGGIYIDKEGHRAQEAGYRDYLRNQDLADQIRQEFEQESEGYHGGEDTPSPPRPASLGQRTVWLVVSLPLLWWAFRLSGWLAHQGHASNPEFFDWVTFFLSLLILPSGLLFWPGLFLLFLALNPKS